MRVRVDEAGRDGFAIGVDLLPRSRSPKIANILNPVADDAQIGLYGWLRGPIED
jgi:hypothetical protein